MIPKTVLKHSIDLETDRPLTLLPYKETPQTDNNFNINQASKENIGIVEEGDNSSKVSDDRLLCEMGSFEGNEKSQKAEGDKFPLVTGTKETESGSEQVGGCPSEKLEVVGRQVLRSDGVYIEGSIQGTNVTFTADTGAARTVLSYKAFRKIPESQRPKLEKSRSLASANGQPLVEKGKAIFNLKLETLILEKELIVAEIEDEALLGLDILMNGVQGPADIKLSEGTILLDGVTIPCIQITSPEPVRKVRSADNFVVPPQSEMIIDVFVDKFNSDPVSSPQDYVIEPNPYFVENNPVTMAASLVDISQEVTNKVKSYEPI